MNQDQEDFLNNFILKQSTEKKIQLLEAAFDEGVDMFLALADVFLKAPCGEGGGLSTELIDSVFQRKNQKLDTWISKTNPKK